MSYFMYIIINFIFCSIFLSGRNGLVISFIIMVINIIGYALFNVKSVTKVKRLEAHNFIKFTYETYLYLNKEDFLNNSIVVINKKYRKEINLLKEEIKKIEYLNEKYQYPVFSLLKKILYLPISKFQKIKALQHISQYSSYYLNINHIKLDKLNRNKTIISIISSNVVLLLIRYLFFIEVDNGFYLLFLFLFIFQSFIVAVTYLKDYKDGKYFHYYEYLISLDYLTPFNALELFINNLKKKKKKEFLPLVKDYQEKKFDSTYSLINKYKDDEIITSILLFMYRISINNSLSKVDQENLSMLMLKIDNESESIKYNFINTINVYLLLIGILYFIYNILVRYGTF